MPDSSRAAIGTERAPRLKLAAASRVFDLLGWSEGVGRDPAFAA